MLVYGRSLDGEAGHHVVTPLLLPDGGAVLVVRGWVPFAMQAAPVRAAAPPANGIASSLPYDVFPLPLQLADQTPPQPGSLPIPVPLPTLSEGPHLSYAIQWFSFAVVAFVGAVILLRRDRGAATGAP